MSKFNKSQIFQSFRAERVSASGLLVSWARDGIWVVLLELSSANGASRCLGGVFSCLHPGVAASLAHRSGTRQCQGGERHGRMLGRPPAKIRFFESSIWTFLQQNNNYNPSVSFPKLSFQKEPPLSIHKLNMETAMLSSLDLR